MKRKRVHKNTTRLTARERAENVAASFCRAKREPHVLGDCPLAKAIECAIQAAVRQALARDARRRDKDFADYMAKRGGDQALARKKARST